MVGDLGLGKTVDMSSRLTMIAGTPTFVAPEQAQGERIDARADQYSLAALTYLLLTGRPPHAHATLAAAASPGEPEPMSTPDWPVPAGRRGRRTAWPGVRPRRTLADGGRLHRGARRRRGHQRPRPGRQAAGARDRSAAHAAGRAAVTPHRAAAAARHPLRLPSGAGGVCSSPSPQWCCWSPGGAVGYAAWQGLDGTTTLSDSRSTLTVTVPDDWDTTTATDGWQPPDSDTTYPALSVGSSSDWETDGGEGVFVGVLPGTKLPTSVPGHPECGSVEGTIDDDRNGDRSKTVYYTDCPFVTVERVVQVAANRLLWVQVRADSRSTAVAVLDSVVTHGL